jgi:hypothetical protein
MLEPARTLSPRPEGTKMPESTPEQNKAFVLEAFDTHGILAEHWDVIQDEATEEQSKSKAPMFGGTFPTYR